jgi:hypothetical protein
MVDLISWAPLLQPYNYLVVCITDPRPAQGLTETPVQRIGIYLSRSAFTYLKGKDVSRDVMASTRQPGERMRVEAFKALVADVKAAPADRLRLIKKAMADAVHLSDKSKDTFRGQCNRVTNVRVLPIFDDALRFSEQVVAERYMRDAKLPTVQHVLLDVCKRIIDKSWKSPQQVLNDLQAAYQTAGAYPPD